MARRHFAHAKEFDASVENVTVSGYHETSTRKYKMAFLPEISASKVAGFIGLHKYQNPTEIAYELLCRNEAAKAKIQEIERTHNRRSFHQVLTEVLKDQAIQDCVATGLREAQTTPNVTKVLESVQASANLVLSLRHQFPPELQARLSEEVRGKVSKQRGLNNETHILDTYEAKKNVKVTERNTKLIKKPFETFVLVGRCDGYVASENRIVDSKDRTRHWPHVPLYDEIQLRCYMNMYDAKESELIERFPSGDTRHTVFLNNPQQWETIQTALTSSVQGLHTALADPEELKRIVFANTVAM